MKNRRSTFFSPRKPATCEGLARACQLSVWTTSLALNRHPRVKLATQKRVAEMAAKLGYAPNGATRRLAKGRFEKSNTTLEHAGFLLLSPPHWTTAAPYVAFMRGAGLGFADQDVSMVLLTASDEKHWQQAERIVSGKMLDGWLLAGAVTDDVVRRVRRWKQPFVVLGDHFSSHAVHQVNADHEGIGRLAVRDLACLGHRRIGLLGTNSDFQYSRDIRSGFLSAIRKLGLDRNEKWIQYTDGTESTHTYVSEMLKRMLATKPHPTAIVIAESDHLQLALSYVRQLKARAFQEITFVSCEINAASVAFPGATQIRFPYEQVGREGAHFLKRVAGHPRIPTQCIKIPPAGLQASASVQPNPSTIITP